jgi:hypothetical protein
MMRRVVQISVTVGLLALLAWSVETRDVLSFLQRIDLVYGGAALALLLLQNELVTRRWTVVLKAFVPPPTHFRMLRIVYLALFAQLFLPTSIGGAFVRAGMLFRAGVSLGVAANSVILDRLIALGGLILFAAVFLPAVSVPWTVDQEVRRLGFIIAGIAVASLATVIGALKLQPLTYWLSLLNRTPIRHLLTPVQAAASNLKNPRRIVAALALSLAAQLVTICAVFVLAMGMGLSVRLIDCLLVMPPVMLIASLPISISGWGVREGAMMVAFGLLDVPKEAALALSVQFALLGYLAATPGALAWLIEVNARANKRTSEDATDGY